MNILFNQSVIQQKSAIALKRFKTPPTNLLYFYAIKNYYAIKNWELA